MRVSCPVIGRQYNRLRVSGVVYGIREPLLPACAWRSVNLAWHLKHIARQRARIRARKHSRRSVGNPAAGLFLQYSRAVFGAVCLLPLCAAVVAQTLSDQAPLIGTRVSEWHVRDWLNADPVSLQELRGRPVLVRWWTAGCSLCATSTGSLNSLHERYAPHGLFVLGLYHHKSPGPLSVADVHDYARRFDYRFPIAIDHDWRTLQSWWLSGGARDYTSVSMLLDQEGIVRYVHPGGRLTPGSDEFIRLERQIQALLSPLG